MWPVPAPPVGALTGAPLYSSVSPGVSSSSYARGAPALPVWPPAPYLAWSTDAPAALSLARVTIHSGCVPGDNLTIQGGAFFGRVQPAPQPSCAAGLELWGTGSLFDFVGALQTVKFVSNATSSADGAPRVVKFDLVGLATLFSKVIVSTPPDPPAALTSPRVSLLEGAPPDFAVVVQRDCGAGAAVLGLPAFCYESDRLPYSRSESGVDAYAGTSMGPLALADLSSAAAAPTFGGYVASGACGLSWIACPIGPWVFDCSGNPVAAPGPTSPTSCLWRRYRALLNATVCPAALDVACGPGCVLDFEAAYCPAASVMVASRAPGLALTASLSVFGAAAQWVTLSVGDSNEEASALAWVGTPPNASFPLRLDDSAPRSPAPLMYFCSQDSVPPAASVSFVTPLQGAAVLPAGGATTRSVLQVDPVSSSIEWLSSPPFAACYAQLQNSTPPPSGSSWANVTIFSLKAAAPGALRTVPARALSVSLYPYAGAPPAAALTLPVLLTRANRQVAWVGAASIALVENAPPGFHATPTLLVADDDAEQDVAFSITSVVLQSCDGGAPPVAPFSVPPSLFALAPLPNLTTVTDFATGAVRQDVPSTRRVAVAVGADALDIDEPASAWGVPATAACTFRLTILARDNGDPTPSQSLLPLQDPTIATATVDVRVTRDAANKVPNVTAFERVPPAGLSADGGDMVELVGSGLGLPAGPTASVSGALFSITGATFPLVNCTVIARLTRVRCVATAGFGSLAGGSVSVGSRAAINFSVPTLPAYARPQAVAVADAGSGGAQWHGAVGDFTGGAANVSVLVSNVPGSASLSALGRAVALWAALQLEGDAFLPLGGCTRSATPRASVTAGANLFSNTTFALAAAARHAAWFDCPLPRVSGGFFQGVLVHAEFPLVSSGAGTDFFPFFGAEEEPFFVTSAGGGGRPRALPPALLARAWARVAPPRATPAISSVLQAAPGLAFTVTGSALGDAPLAWHSDRIEYARVEADGRATPDCASSAAAAALLASCAVHVGVGCTYVVPHAAISCRLETGGWGAGFRVRAVVGGAASPWSAAAVLAYAPPQLQRLSVVGLLGAGGGNDTALEPGGGGLLTLHGANLWPPHAVVVTVGGVRVYPVQARPLAPTPPLRECEGTDCFGNGSTACGAGFPANATLAGVGAPLVAGNLTVTYPPGLGTVTVELALGNVSAALNASYAPPRLLALVSAAQAVPPDTSWVVAVAGARLSPCVVECAFGGTCTALVGSRNSSSFASTFPAYDPLADAADGALPRIRVAPPPPERCALPSAGGLWEWRAREASGELADAALQPLLSLPALRARYLRAFPAAVASGAAAAARPFPLNILSASFAPFAGGDKVEMAGWVGTADGNLTLRYVAASLNRTAPPPLPLRNVAPPTSLTIPRRALNFSRSSPRVVRFETPSSWLAEPGNATDAFGTIVTLQIKNTGPFGAVLLFPSASVGSVGKWGGGPLPCPIVGKIAGSAPGAPLPTQMILTDEMGNADIYGDPDVALIAVFGDTWQSARSGGESGTPFLNPFSSPPKWEFSNGSLPCWLTQWSGAKVGTGLLLDQQYVSFYQPAWMGGAVMEAEVYTRGEVSSSEGAAMAVFSMPQILGVSPASYATPPSGGPVLLTGKNFGRAPSLRTLWETTGARAVAKALLPAAAACRPPLPAPLLEGWRNEPAEHPQRVFFSYSWVGAPSRKPGGEALRRYCGAEGDPAAAPPRWSDSSIQCWAPEGVAGSLNFPVFQLDAAATTLVGETNATTSLVLFPGSSPLTYAQPVIHSVAWDPHSEPPLFTLLGANFSRFSPLPGRLDPSEGMWDYTVVVKGVINRGLVNGINAQQGRFTVTRSNFSDSRFFDTSIALTGAPNTATLPPLVFNETVAAQLPQGTSPFVPQLLEGAVTFALEFAPRAGLGWNGDSVEVSATRSGEVELDVSALAPPALISVVAVEVNATMDVAVEVNGTTDDGAMDPCTPNAMALCKGQPFFTPPDRGVRCFRSMTSPTSGAPPRLRLRGAFFGSFAAPREFLLTPINASLAARGPAVPCLLQAPSINRWARTTAGESTLFCDVLGVLPRGPMRLHLSLAFSSAYKTSFSEGGDGALKGVVPLGACPCGFYSEVDGRACAPCPPNAFCQGGLEPPRAQRDYWETNASEWAARGFGVVAIVSDGSPLIGPIPGGANVSRFVECPVPGTCLPAQRCAPGSTGFMCTECIAEPVLYRRGATGACERCSKEDPLMLVLSLVFAPPLLLALAAALFWLCRNEVRCMRAIAALREGASTAGATAAQCAAYVGAVLSACGRSACRRAPVETRPAEGLEEGAVLDDAYAPGDAPDPDAAAQNFTPLLKIAITYLQTVGVLASFVSTTAPGRKAKDGDGDALLLPRIVNALSVFTNMGLNLSQLRCAVELRYEFRVTLLVLLPFLSVTVVPLAWWVLRGAANAARGAAFRWAVSHPGFVTLREGAAGAKNAPTDLTLSLSAVAVSALFLLLPVAITSLARAQECGRDELGAYLKEDPTVPCKLFAPTTAMAREAVWVFIALPGVVGLWCCAGAPGYQLFDFVQRGYHQMSYLALYYEFITLLRKAALTGLATNAIFFDAGSKDPRVGLIFSVEVLAFSLLLHQLVWPFGKGVAHNEALNWLEVGALFSTLTASLAILARLQSAMGTDLPMPVGDQNLLDVFAVLMCLPFVCSWIVLFLDASLCGGRLVPALSTAGRKRLRALVACARPVAAWAARKWRTAKPSGYGALARTVSGRLQLGALARMASGRLHLGPGGGGGACRRCFCCDGAGDDEDDGDGGVEQGTDMASKRFREAMAQVNRREEARVGLAEQRPLPPSASEGGGAEKRALASPGTEPTGNPFEVINPLRRPLAPPLSIQQANANSWGAEAEGGGAAAPAAAAAAAAAVAEAAEAVVDPPLLWNRVVDPSDGAVWYENLRDGSTRWELPPGGALAAETAAAAAPPAQQWQRVVDPSDGAVYWRHSDGSTSWDPFAEGGAAQAPAEGGAPPAQLLLRRVAFVNPLVRGSVQPASAAPLGRAAGAQDGHSFQEPMRKVRKGTLTAATAAAAVAAASGEPKKAWDAQLGWHVFNRVYGRR